MPDVLTRELAVWDSFNAAAPSGHCSDLQGTVLANKFEQGKQLQQGYLLPGLWLLCIMAFVGQLSL